MIQTGDVDIGKQTGTQRKQQVCYLRRRSAEQMGNCVQGNDAQAGSDDGMQARKAEELVEEIHGWAAFKSPKWSNPVR